MTLFAARSASLVLLFPLAASSLGCVQVVDFGGADTETDTDPVASTNPAATPNPSADDGTGSSATTSTPEDSTGDTGSSSDETGGTPVDPPDGGGAIWPAPLGAAVHGIAPLDDGGMVVVGRVENEQGRFGAVRVLDAAGKVVHDHAPAELEDLYLWDVCVRPDGSLLAIGIVADSDGTDFENKAYAVFLDDTGAVLSTDVYDPFFVYLDYVSMVDMPRLVCNGKERAWAVLSYLNEKGREPLFTLAIESKGFGNQGQGAWHYGQSALIGMGGDPTGGYHYAVNAEVYPKDVLRVMWQNHSADGLVGHTNSIHSPELPGEDSLPLAFHAVGERGVVLGSDAPTDTHWLVAYDLEGNELWRTDDLPAPSEAWHPQQMGVASDGRVAIAGWAGPDTQQAVSLLVFDADGSRSWSAEYDDLEKPGYSPSHLEVGEIVVTPDRIDLGGSFRPFADEDTTYGWILRIDG
ncbi:MAG: hypothetical protein AAF799_48385 [Myxococcota bacterium]